MALVAIAVNGANRLGSNSLTEILVFGARAGHAAAQFALAQPDPSLSALEAQAKDEQQRITRDYLHKTGGTERLAAGRTDLWEADRKSVV